MQLVISFVSGLILGSAVVMMISRFYHRNAGNLARELVAQAQIQKASELENFVQKIKDSFGSLSLDALSRTSQEFLRLANETLQKQTSLGGKDLEGKKQLIDQALYEMKEDLKRVQDLVISLEKDRREKFGEISNQLKVTGEQTMRLQETTGMLRAALTSSKERGQWGERMAEDVLRFAGFVEGINYQKQKTMDSGRSRPDYTFFLPKGLTVNMDVKFPLDNYLRYLQAQGEKDRQEFKSRFLKDARNRINEVTGRDYINPEESTVDYVIVFIPNETVYAFMNEQDSSLLDHALKRRVILCSPVTLYAILAVIRQAVDNFNLEKTAAYILGILGNFNKQWGLFIKSFDKLGRKIEEAGNEFSALVTTRKNQLERPLREIEDLRRRRNIDLPVSESGDMSLPEE